MIKIEEKKIKKKMIEKGKEKVEDINVRGSLL